MGRLLVLLALAFAPLVAGAHGAHHAPAREGQATPVPQPASSIQAVGAPSRCPGGHDACCCHDATGTSSFQPVVIDAPSAFRPALPFRSERGFNISRDVPRGLALARYSPRGPPALA